jgi:hypothetical protein
MWHNCIFIYILYILREISEYLAKKSCGVWAASGCAEGRGQPRCVSAVCLASRVFAICNRRCYSLYAALISRYYTPLHMHDATRNGVTHLAALRGDHLISDLRLTQVGRCLPDV